MPTSSNGAGPNGAGAKTSPGKLRAAWDRLDRGLKIHVCIFVGVMILLAAFDWWTAEPYWAHWVFLGWGAGVLGHAYLAHRG
jgi:hypothetical protein